VARRSKGDAPEQADVYLADSMGEMGLWYALCDVVFLGGSFSDAGGHNPYEPAQAGCAILCGPKVANFADVYAEFEAKEAISIVKSPKRLSAALQSLIQNPAVRAAQADQAKALAHSSGQEIQDLAQTLLTQTLDQ
jgi:3-deoxy-D-manno-octulosonic-acid transferase